MAGSLSVKKIIWFLKTILSFDDGIAILLGAAPVPSSEEIFQTIRVPAEDCGVRVDGGSSVCAAEAIVMAVEPFDDVVSQLGGWPKINEIVCSFRDENPGMWERFVPLVSLIQPGGRIRDGLGGMSAMLSVRFGGVCEKTLRRWKKETMRALAIYLLTWARADGFSLSYDLYKKSN
ncbi:MAG: hypothetical protein IJM42_05285 [Synergistes sp.]|nr:hypothetical protein [Synergistes sp.]